MAAKLGRICLPRKSYRIFSCGLKGRLYQGYVLADGTILFSNGVFHMLSPLPRDSVRIDNGKDVMFDGKIVTQSQLMTWMLKA
jgi:hypothetical protein